MDGRFCGLALASRSIVQDQFCIAGPGLPCAMSPLSDNLCERTGHFGVHVKTNHSTVNMFRGQRLQRMLGNDAKGDVLPWERAGPGR